MNLSTTNETINNSYQNQNSNANLLSYNAKPQLSTNQSTLNSNPFIMPKTSLNFKPLSSPKSDNLKIKILEKDKLIFDYMKKEKEFTKSIDILKSSLKEKENEILKLQQEIQLLEFKFSKKQNIMNLKNEEYTQLTDEKQNFILDLQKENNDLNNKIINLNNVIKTLEENQKNNYENFQKNSNKISDLINQITKNENILKMMKQNENNLREENKQIPSLKRKITDLENIIKEYQNKITELKKDNDKIINDKEELNNIINKKTEEIQKEKVNEQYVIRLNYKIDYLSNELNLKNIENENLNNKYSLLQKDLDTFINIFINELNNYLNYLEGLNIYSKTLYKLPPCTFPNFENININQDFRTRYDVMGKVIHQIKDKITDILNKNIEKNQNLLIDYMNKDNNYKLILDEKEKILKDKDELGNTISSTNDQIKKYKLELQKFQKDYGKLKSDLLKIQDINKDYVIKNKILNQKFNDFVNDIENQLKDFPYKSKVNKDNLQNKIISQINSLIILTKELNNENKNLEKENKGYKLEIENIKKDNKNLKKEIHDNSKETTNKIITIKNTNDNEIKNQKKIFYDKIHKLNDLLEESNRIIRTYEKEVTYLKNKNLKLENNLKLLSQSHKELEKIINTSTSGLKSEIDIKDQKYNDLLKELQLKDVHIKSLENLFDKQNKPEAGKIFTKINAIPLNLSDDDNNYIINNEDGLNTTFNKNKNNNNIYSDNAFNQGGDNFGRDEVNEMKLNKLINNFEIKNKINNFNKDNLNLNQNQNKNFMELKDLIKQSGDDLNDSNVEGQNYILDENNQ